MLVPDGPVARSALIRLGQPAHLALHRLEAVLLQREGVLVGPLAAAGQRGRDRLEALLETAAPALEDAQPDVGAGATEEREVDAEGVVLPRRRTGLADQPARSAPCRPR
ncbi:hypothetical protein GCM10025868_23490 [Angustibacter aerolatus]|uniref:Uncharacterized protein n=1 Tax=Angustibacter aerolatus TaxID=1162965 RepID=A0ABQ6JIA5_9ACTN|nr:hypothetical protein GCM10025868_23490 [Angustibacter aerolatus]